MLVSYSWLKDYLGENTKSAEELADLLTFHSFEIDEVKKVDDDTVIDIDVLPNRSSDCLCHRGIARELATLLSVPLVHDPLSVKPELKETKEISVQIEDTKACPRFTASLLKNVEVKESPEWLKKRLAAIGQRSINNIVDATNFVMFSIGQPIHAYDADLFPQKEGVWKFKVRLAKPGEKVGLIAESGKSEDREVDLDGTELLIVDESSDTPIGLAGVKGGSFAGVHPGTKNVIIEAAHFDPVLTRKTARRLGIVIDASKRFENEPSRELPSFAQAEIIKLIGDIAGGIYEGSLDEYPEKTIQPKVSVSIAKTNSLLGLQLTQEEIKNILERVGCVVEETADGFSVTGPWERTDLNIEEDLIEEVGRIYGYDHVESVVPDQVTINEINKRYYYSERIREILLDYGFSEIITSSFRKKDDIQLANALATDKSYVRSGIGKNISEALDRNANHTDLLGTNDTRLFEIGTVFDRLEEGLSEHTSLALGVRVKTSGYSGKEDKIIEEVVSALSGALGVKFAGKNEQGVFEVNLSQVMQELPDPTSYEEVKPASPVVYKPFSTYPAISRDIAMWVQDEVSAMEVENILNDTAGELRVRTTLFDEFTKDGRTSYAFRLVFQSQERTLTDEEINKVMEAVYKKVSEQGWEVR